MPHIQANTNGVLRDAAQPSLSPLDRSFLYGDSIYEVWRTYRGTLFAVEEHWDRLRSSAEGTGIALPFPSMEGMLAEISRTVAAWRENAANDGDVYVRLQVSRGGGPIGLDTNFADNATYVLLVKEQPDLAEAELDRGFVLAIPAKTRRNSSGALPPALKTGNYLNNIQGLREAISRGADDALFLNDRGELSEASTRNIWAVFPDRIVTPPLSADILAGITRLTLLKNLGEFEGRQLVESTLRPQDLEAAEEVFLSSTTQDIQPVCRIDERKFPTGPGTVTRRLKDWFAGYVDKYVASHPQYAM